MQTYFKEKYIHSVINIKKKIFPQKVKTFKPGMGKILPEILGLPNKMMAAVVLEK